MDSKSYLSSKGDSFSTCLLSVALTLRTSCGLAYTYQRLCAPRIFASSVRLLSGIFVHKGRAIYGVLLDTGRQRNGAAHFRARPFRRVHDLLGRRIEDAMVEGLEPDSYVLTLHLDGLKFRSAPFSGGALLSSLYSMIDATTPAPTVRPPSRMAKRSFSSMAIGTISSTVMAILSPGITISVPSGRCTTPVTSVVRK